MRWIGFGLLTLVVIWVVRSLRFEPKGTLPDFVAGLFGAPTTWRQAREPVLPPDTYNWSESHVTGDRPLAAGVGGCTCPSC